MTPMLTNLSSPSTLAVAETSAGRLLADDPWWLVLGKALAIFVFLVVMTLFSILAERKVVARMQHRVGPNRTGPFGMLQSLADGIKLALKEDIVPKAADKVVYIIAPIISVIPAFMAFAVIPLGPEVTIFGEQTVLQLVDLPVGVLFILAFASIGVYGIVLGGWASGSTYPLLGGLRSTAQVISYEIAMGLSFVAVFLYAGSLATSEIVAAQGRLWFAIALFPSFVVYLISMVGETNRAPFDLAEAEGELVGGFHTEYSSLKFALFFLAEYINMVTVSALATTLFLGGWQAPWPLSIWDGANEGWLPVLWFVAKVLLFIFVFIWLRGTLPRLRYDQFMKLGWKVLIPFALAWTMIVATVRAVTNDTGIDRQELFLGLAVVFGIVLLAVLAAEYVGRRREETVPPAGEGGTPGGGGGGGTPFDPFAGGHPVPPMPGQQAEQVPVLSGSSRAGAEGISHRQPADHQPGDHQPGDHQPGDRSRTESTRG